MSNILPGFRFYPTEEELIGFYLHNKLENTRDDLERIMPVVDLYSYDPWQLPMISGGLCRNDGVQWFFFSPRHDREVRGGRPNRITPSGYWKATGSPNFVYSSNNRLIGAKRTMVFYEGRAPSGTKTEWKMNEYKAVYQATETSTRPRNQSQEFSLCRVYKGSGLMRSFDRRPLPSPEQANISGQHEGVINVEPRNIIPNSHGEIIPSQACNGLAGINNSHRNSASMIQDSLHEETMDWEMIPDFFLLWD